MQERRLSIPDNLWCRCPQCSEMLFTKELTQNFQICPKCGYHFPLTAPERIQLLADPGSFRELSEDTPPELAVGGVRIGRRPAVLFVTTGWVPGAFDQLRHAAEIAATRRHPLIGIYRCMPPKGAFPWPLVQAIHQLDERRIPYIVLLTDATPEIGYCAPFPVGDLILGERSTNHEAKALPRPTNPNAPEVPAIPGEAMLDRFVDRRECAQILGTLLAFFEENTKGKR